ncbi:MAG: nitroreductase family protein [Treponema sp.]|jgi:nitroreductase|nr:nitroreductase family protein [Treponema sp.]
MKKYLFAFVILSMGMGALSIFAQQAGPAGVIINHYAANNNQFVAGTIPGADLDRIVQAGVRAPSAGNRQPWHFTVVQDLTLVKKIVPQAVNGNVLIVISAEGGGKINGAQIIDCALAAESVYLAAQALGYGSRIYTGPIDSINRSLKSDLGLPVGHSAVVLVRAGRISAGIDAVSAASSRRSANDLVTYK